MGPELGRTVTTSAWSRLSFPCRPPELPSDHDVRELRLALVCYGGVSLAIYMHGITKELEKLVRASARFASGDATNPFSPDRTEYAYFNLLERKARQDGYRTCVIVDIISGTSAGGINGVCLAKAIAQDAPQDGLRNLWLTKGAIIKLLRVPFLVPLAGNRMLGWLRQAFEEMDRESRGTLLPQGLMLNLFVTTTDMHGLNRRIPIADPPAITTVVNKCVFEFANRDLVGNLDAAHNPAIAFSARASSSFPGAFPPTRISDIQPQAARDAFPAEFCRPYELAESPATATFFIDGGVLDNYPFRHAVRAIPGKPAATQVDRKLLFIEPDPPSPLRPPDGSAPGMVKTIWAGLSKLPRRQPIADALDELMLYNRKVRRIKQMIGTVRQQIYLAVNPLLGLSWDDANRGANTGAIAANQIAFQSYLRLKLLSVVEGMAAAVSALQDYPPASTQSLFVRHVLLQWAQDAGILDPALEITEDQCAFLRSFDLGYGRRRFTFVIGRINDFYGVVDRESLNALKHRLYELLCELETVLTRPDAAPVHEWIDRVFTASLLKPYLDDWRVAAFLDNAKDEIQEVRALLGIYLDKALDGFGERSYAEFQRLTEPLPPDVRDDLRAHYIGFPYWDAATYPARALSEIVELDEVEVVRVSPLDSTSITPPEDGFVARAWKLVKKLVFLGPPPNSGKRIATAATKLRGVSLAHFAGFFRRSWRENDYLWGRLDGAERLIWLLAQDPGDRHAAEREAFRAIAAEERPQLRKAKRLIRRVEEHLASPPTSARS